MNSLSFGGKKVKSSFNPSQPFFPNPDIATLEAVSFPCILPEHLYLHIHWYVMFIHVPVDDISYCLGVCALKKKKCFHTHHSATCFFFPRQILRSCCINILQFYLASPLLMDS